MKMEKIVVNNVSKKFSMESKRNTNTLQRIVSILMGKENKSYLWALRNVSFSVKSQEIVGIIGYNGSGKSTLLKIISGIYTKDCGSIKTKGKVVPILGAGTGLNNRLTMKDNIYLLGTFLGLSQKEIKIRFNDIVNFSGLGNFVNTKLYKFSSGMMKRLAFSISVHSDPEVLLLDEVFEVGDKNFKIIAAKKIHELAKKGSSIIFVTHNIDNIKLQCDRVIWLHKGKILMTGKPKLVCHKYMTTELSPSL